MLVRWADGGRGARSMIPTTTDTIMDLKALPAGVAVANGGPAISLVGADGAFVTLRGPAQPDLRDQEEVFAVSKDGRSVRFGLEPWGKQPLRFDLARRAVSVDAPADPPSPRPA